MMLLESVKLKNPKAEYSAPFGEGATILNGAALQVSTAEAAPIPKCH